MKPAHPEPAAILHRVRQQLILAQVRIMELEDARDETASRLANTEKLLGAAQTVADQKLDEAAHLRKTQDDLQAQFEHLRHVQHVTNAALEACRGELASAVGVVKFEKQVSADLAVQFRQLETARENLESQLRDAIVLTATRQQRIEQLDTEVRTLKSTRSWRWTAWVRSLERFFGGNKS